MDPYLLKFSDSEPVPCCFVYCSFVIYVDTSDCGNSSLFFLRIALAIFSLLFLSIQLLELFSWFWKKESAFVILIGIPLSLETALGGIVILTIILLYIFLLFVSSSVSFMKVFNFQSSSFLPLY